MNILWTALIGLVAGVIARVIAPGKRDPSGFLLTAVLGMVGGFADNSLGQEAGWYDSAEPAALIAAVVGAVVVLGIWGVLFRRRSSSWL